MNEKGEDMMTEQEREKLADEIIKLFKEKNLTVRAACRTLMTAREKLDNYAYERKLNQE